VSRQGATADDVSAVILEVSPVTVRAEDRHQWHQTVMIWKKDSKSEIKPVRNAV
jgi:hypothetical protein